MTYTHDFLSIMLILYEYKTQENLNNWVKYWVLFVKMRSGLPRTFTSFCGNSLDKVILEHKKSHSVSLKNIHFSIFSKNWPKVKKSKKFFFNWPNMTFYCIIILIGIISKKTSNSPEKSGGGLWTGNNVSQNTFQSTPDYKCMPMYYFTIYYNPV